MQKYEITIKDNSIPEHMQKAISNFHDKYTAIIDVKSYYNDIGKITLFDEIENYITAMAQDLNTDPESLEILSIIKQ